MATERAKLFMVDAFTRNSLEGNPCSVFVTSTMLSDELRRRLAKETNTIVSVFISWRAPTDKMSVDIRYHTPITTLELCGHATISAVKVLYDEFMLPTDQEIDLYYTSTEKLVAKWCDEYDVSINMPQLPLTEIVDRNNSEVFQHICDGLQIKAEDVIYFGKNIYDHVVQVKDTSIVKTCIPDFGKLIEVDTRATILTAQGGRPRAQQSSNSTAGTDTTNFDNYDTISRVFLPRVGIDEDAVCGSAHCGIAAHYSAQLSSNELFCYEPSHRPGSLRLSLLEGGRLHLRAPCHITFGPSVVHLPKK